MIYKVSYVVAGRPEVGAIVNLDAPPQVGDRVRLDEELCEVTEVITLIPARGEFAYLHATCQPVQDAGCEI